MSYNPQAFGVKLPTGAVIGTLVEHEAGKRALIAASGTDPHFFVGRLKESSTSGVHIDFCVNQRSTGYILLDKQAP